MYVFTPMTVQYYYVGGLRWFRHLIIRLHLAMANFRHNLFVFNGMAAKLCKELQILFGNNMKYSDFIDGKYFLRN